MNAERILKSIHVLTHMPIHLFDRSFDLIASFTSDTAKIVNYDFRRMATDASTEERGFSILTGSFGEMFILYAIEDRYALFGPFRCNVIDRDSLEQKLAEQDIPQREWRMLTTYLQELPLYALGDLRDIITHINYCFTGSLEDPLSENLHAYVRSFYMDFDRERIGKYDGRTFDPQSYLYYYESEILSYVNAGKVEDLKDMVFRLGNAVIPSTSGDMLRSEKNYSIVVFQKLSRAGIDAGCDIVESTLARDAFIRRTEEAHTLQGVLKIRDAAIVFFTAEVGKTRAHGYSQLVTSIVQFIGLNTNRALRVQQIADAFHLSTSAVQKKFKAETGATIQQYIMKRKIEGAKVMLKSGLSVTDVATALGFFDSSHFSRTFKKVAHITPKRYQESQVQLPSRKEQ